MDILRLLSDGQFHSGVQLAEKLNVSRTTISNHISKWVERGLDIDSVTGKGYRLQTPIQWLDQQIVLSQIPADVRQHLYSLSIPMLVTSTNDVVAEFLREHNHSGVVCVSEMQEAGRGRRGRVWMSPPGGNFYGSFGWIFMDGFSAVEGLSLAAGVAVIKALESIGVQGLQLKWPNDILWQGQKLGGILIEMSGEVSGPCQVVVGVGINLQISAKIKEQILQPVVDLNTICGYGVDRQKLTVAVISELILLLRSYQETGFARWHHLWLSCDAFRNKQVTITGLQQPTKGIAKGVDKRGALLLQTTEGLISIYGGEVSLSTVDI